MVTSEGSQSGESSGDAPKPKARKAPVKKAPAKKAPAKKAPVKPVKARQTHKPPKLVPGQRMSGWDFATWRAASDDPVMRSTIIGLLVLDKSPDWDTLVDRFDRASRNAPVLRKKVVEGITPMETPRLVVDPNFDLLWHLRRFRMPAKSTWHDVLEDARRQSMTDFDRDRPLWRVTLLEGLPGGRSALLVKLHHAIADGQGAVMLGISLFDFSEAAQDLGPMPEAPEPEELSRSEAVQASVRDNFGWAARTASDVVRGIGPAALAAMRSPGDTVQRVVRTAESVLRFTKIPTGPLSPLMERRSINYHFDTFDLDFAKLKTAAKSHGATSNDLFLAAVAEGLGAYHDAMGLPVERLRVNMPISLRQTGEGSSMSNAVTIARFELPVRRHDPLSVMKDVGEMVTRWRKEPALAMADQLAEMSRLIPAEVISAAAQASDMTASNVPGPPIPVWIAGAQVERMYPLVATIGAAVNVTLLTYKGIACVGVSTDDAAVDDREELVRSLKSGFEAVSGARALTGTPVTVRHTSAKSAVVHHGSKA